ncbi:MAG: hypothetical protein M3Y75_06950 [Actinomycetota bacterium]|nr:hypothetical protein [Actinomycetota bacterium]
MFLALTAPASQAAPVNTDAVLLQTEEAPWGDEFNEEAMEAVFGEDWEVQDFDEVQADAGPGGLFASGVRFIWIEGSDDSTEAADEFVEANEASLKAFVARGGGLFVNNATNAEITIEYDGRAIGMDNSEDFTDAALAVNPDHPIFKGPAGPNVTSFTGNSFAHGRVTGPDLTPLIVGTENEGPVNDAVVLAEYASGSGRVALGSMVDVGHQDPEDAAKALRINLVHYLTPPVPPAPPALPTTPAPPAPLSDTKKPQVKLTGMPKGCVEEGFRFQVKVSDESGVGAVTVKLDGKPLRKADGKGNPSRSFKIRVPGSKLDKPGRHKIKVIARDSAGNVKRQGAGFKVCE